MHQGSRMQIPEGFQSSFYGSREGSGMSGLLSSSPIARGSISSSVEIPVGFNSCPGSASQPQQQLPQVTISHDVEGRQIEYPNPGLDSGLFRDSRIFRSHSLTPMGSISKFSVPDCDPKKLRSNSVTLGSGEHQHKQRYPDVGVEGPEFKDLRDWMKSLRLHKYTDRLLGFSFDDLMALTDSDLQGLLFTDGAKNKFLKQLALVRERPLRIREIRAQLDATEELKDLLNILPELEKLILMPIKISKISSSQSVTVASHHHQLRPAAPALTQLSREANRHESGSDSGTEMITEEPPKDVDVSQELFDMLEKTFSLILCKQCDDSDRDKVVRNFFYLLDRRCLKKEAFTPSQKQLFNTWLKRMDQVWDISRVLETSSAMERRKFERRPSGDFMRRSSLQPGNTSQCFPFGPKGQSPSYSSVYTTPQGNHGLFGDRHHHGGGHGFGGGDLHADYLQVDPSFHGASSGARRSVPDIFPSNTNPPINRHSYQGDHRMPPLVDSQVLTNTVDARPRGFSLTSASFLAHSHSSSSFGSSGSRRASTLSTASWDSGFSRRSSTMSSGDESRRNSGLCEDRDLYFDRRDSTTSSSETGLVNTNTTGFLSMDPAGTKRSPFLTVPIPGSVSSGCASDEGSTDSLEQDLHKLSLAVTEQALLES